MVATNPYRPAGGPVQQLGLDVLDLDPENPRLDGRSVDGGQLGIAEIIAERYRAIEVATSVAQHGYFPSEPLIAIKDGTRYTVLEGNRRLAALKGLTDDELQAKLGTRWKELARHAAESGHLPDSVPVMVVQTRDEAWPIIGFRHIAGVQTWDPHAKATFIVDRVDSGEGFDEVARITGERETGVRSQYRNWRILNQARDHADDELVDRAREAFGVFTRAMSSISIRGYIGASAPADVQQGDATPCTRPDNLPTLLRWLFGEDDDGSGKVIGESRDLRDLAAVLEHSDARLVLEGSDNLADALAASGKPREGLIKRLERVSSDMTASLDEVASQRTNNRVRTLVESCAKAAVALRDKL
jgi:hypothetical protein